VANERSAIFTRVMDRSILLNSSVKSDLLGLGTLKLWMTCLYYLAYYVVKGVCNSMV